MFRLMFRRLTLTLTCLALAFAQDAEKPIDPAKKTAILHLLSSMHATELMLQQMKLMAPNVLGMLRSNPNLTDKFVDEFGRRFFAEMSSEAMSEILTQGYADHFSLEEIKSLSAFYDSPVGKKIVQVQPEIMNDVSKKAQAYGQSLGMKIAQEIAKEHPDYIKGDATPTNSTPAPPPL